MALRVPLSNMIFSRDLKGRGGNGEGVQCATSECRGPVTPSWPSLRGPMNLEGMAALELGPVRREGRARRGERPLHGGHGTPSSLYACYSIIRVEKIGDREAYLEYWSWWV